MFGGAVTVHHVTGSSNKFAEYYQNNATVNMALELCQEDYQLIPGFVKPNFAQLNVTVA
jgi:hypothetical protein